MNYPGIKINIDMLAMGLYTLILKHPNGACLCYGMFPADLMDKLERELAKKIPDCYHTGDVNAVDGKRVRNAIIQQLCSKILSLATKAGTCIV